MAWIKSSQELPQHPKTKRLCRALGIDVPQAIGHLHLLWYFCLDYAPDGNLSRHATADIADAMMWDGEPQKLIDALINSGFLDSDFGKELSVHDWHEYGGRLLAMRQHNAAKQRKWREEHGEERPSKKRMRAV